MYPRRAGCSLTGDLLSHSSAPFNAVRVVRWLVAIALASRPLPDSLLVSCPYVAALHEASARRQQVPSLSAACFPFRLPPREHELF